MIDISAYLNRINYHGSTQPTAETLRGIHRAHLLAVPFENLDIHLNRHIVLDEAALFEKIVVNRRGGYCYELNGLLASLLSQMGFNVTMFSSNVIHDGIPAEIDHLTLLIQLGERWIVDVGFGDSSRLPLRLVEEEKQFGVDSTYRFVRSEDRWLLQRLIETEEWYNEYSFNVNLTLLALSDFEEANRYYQTAPESYFVQGRICSRAMEDGRVSLTGHELIVTRNGQREETPIEDEQAFVRALIENFGISIENR
ncbi:MAG: arylamine N-acetyltransferase [Anaerolineae bacterium]|nr:arylamine N-acetyltransferase [Anaerolineae bacterium]